MLADADYFVEPTFKVLVGSGFDFVHSLLLPIINIVVKEEVIMTTCDKCGAEVEDMDQHMQEAHSGGEESAE